MFDLRDLLFYLHVGTRNWFPRDFETPCSSNDSDNTKRNYPLFLFFSFFFPFFGCPKKKAGEKKRQAYLLAFFLMGSITAPWNGYILSKTQGLACFSFSLFSLHLFRAARPTLSAALPTTHSPGAAWLASASAVGYSGNRPIDPITCSLTCSPEAVPDAITFLNEPNVTVTASGGNLVLDVAWRRSEADAVVDGVSEPEQRIGVLADAREAGTGGVGEDGAGRRVPHAQLVRGAVCRDRGSGVLAVAARLDGDGADLSVTFKSYQTQVEVIQQGAAPFGQIATKRRLEANETMITRAFRRDYTVTVATRFTAQSVPFSVYAAT